jgi:hypothetical protein
MAAPKRVALCARYSRKAELLKYKAVLEANGYQITSRWLTMPMPEGTATIGKPDAAADWSKVAGEPEKIHLAMMDLEDLRAAATVIVFTEDRPANPDKGQGEPSLGGYHTECGLAIALKKNVVIVGPRENVFHYLPGVVAYPTWETFVRFKGLK